MCQSEILKELKKKKDWMIAGELISLLHISRVAVTRSLRKLAQQGEVESRSYPRKRGGRVIEWKILDLKNALNG